MAHPCSICWPVRRWFNARFKDLCEEHDRRYTRKDTTRREADLLLGASVFMRGYPITALLTFYAVRLFGRNHWRTS
jgi:hypothetical protein